jgi:hypothetical protein
VPKQNDIDQALSAIRIDVAGVSAGSSFQKERFGKLFNELEKDLTVFHGQDADRVVSQAVESLVKRHIIPDLTVINFATKGAKITLDNDKIEIDSQGEKITLSAQSADTKPTIMSVAMKEMKEKHEGMSVRSVLKKQDEVQAESDKAAATAKVTFTGVHVDANTSRWQAALASLNAKGVQNPSRQQAEAEVARMRALEKPAPKK